MSSESFDFEKMDIDTLRPQRTANLVPRRTEAEFSAVRRYTSRVNSRRAELRHRSGPPDNDSPEQTFECHTRARRAQKEALAASLPPCQYRAGRVGHPEATMVPWTPASLGPVAYVEPPGPPLAKKART